MKNQFVTVVSTFAIIVLFSFNIAAGQVGKGSGTWEFTQPDKPHHQAVVAIYGVRVFGPGIIVNSGMGTGVVVAKLKAETRNGIKGYQCLVATAKHVSDASPALTVHYQPVEGVYHTSLATVSVNGNYDGEAGHNEDISILVSWMPEGIQPVKIGKQAEIGDKLESCGYGEIVKVKQRMRSWKTSLSETSYDDVSFICNTYGIGGDSGGPIFNEAGEVVGIVSGGSIWTKKKGIESKATYPCRYTSAKVLKRLTVEALLKQDDAVETMSGGTVEEITTAKGLAVMIKRQDVSVVVFGAEWCNPCQVLKPAVRRLADRLRRVGFGHVDVDRSPSLQAQYNVTGLPTVLYFKAGKLVKSQQGSSGELIEKTIAELQ